MNAVQVEQLAALFRVMADPTRLRILGELADRPQTGQRLAERLNLSAPTISHHMAKLVDAGLVDVRPDAQRRIFSLNQRALREAVASPPVAASSASDASGESIATESLDAEDAKVLRAFFENGRLKTIPAQRKKRVVVLRHLLARFDPARGYSEREVNDLLRRAHDDVATLRRELVDYGFMTRAGGTYRVAPSLPERGRQVAQEVGADEASWFRSLLSNAAAEALAGAPAERSA